MVMVHACQDRGGVRAWLTRVLLLKIYPNSTFLVSDSHMFVRWVVSLPGNLHLLLLGERPKPVYPLTQHSLVVAGHFVKK